MSGTTCTCGLEFNHIEDYRDHMPCPGSELERVKAKVAVLVAALEWYGKRTNHTYPTWAVYYDEGRRARDALEKVKP